MESRAALLAEHLARSPGMLAMPCGIGKASMSSPKQLAQEGRLMCAETLKGAQGTLSMAPPGGSSLSQR